MMTETDDELSTADFWRAVKAQRRSEKAIRTREVLRRVAALEHAGWIAVERFNGGNHLRLTNPLTRARVDFYPTTGRVRYYDAERRKVFSSPRFGLDEALSRIGVEG